MLPTRVPHQVPGVILLPAFHCCHLLVKSAFSSRGLDVLILTNLYVCLSIILEYKLWACYVIGNSDTTIKHCACLKEIIDLLNQKTKSGHDNKGIWRAIG